MTNYRALALLNDIRYSFLGFASCPHPTASIHNAHKSSFCTSSMSISLRSPHQYRVPCAILSSAIITAPKLMLQLNEKRYKGVRVLSFARLFAARRSSIQTEQYSVHVALRHGQLCRYTYIHKQQTDRKIHNS